MKQFLFYQLRADTYKKPPVVRIRVNGKLVDEKNLDSCQQIDYTGQRCRLDPKKNISDTASLEKFSVIEFENTDKKIKLQFDVLNTDNNYTNGFMTRSTLVNMNFCYLLDENFLKSLPKIYKEYRYQKKFIHHLIGIKRFYAIQGNFIENHAMHCDVKDLNTGKTLIAGSTAIHQKIGGNVSFVFDLKRKHNVWFSDKNRSIGILRIGNAPEVIRLVNKYKHYEN